MKRPILQISFLTFLGVFLSSATLVLGAIPLRLLYRIQGPRLFFIYGGLVSGLMGFAGFGALSLTLGGLFLLIGSFSWLENSGIGWLKAAGISIVVTSATSLVMLQSYFSSQGLTIMSMVQTQVDEFIKRLVQLNPEMQISNQTIMAQIPSGFIAIMLISLAIALMYEEKFIRIFQLPLGVSKGSSVNKLIGFKVPNFFIWMLMGSFLFSFLKVTSPAMNMIASNVLNVVVILYFFQGLAIVGSFFKVFQVGLFWRILFYFVLIFQLFLFVAVIGVVDYWVDFRQRFQRKKMIEIKKMEK